VIGYDSEAPITDKAIKKSESLVGSVLQADIVLLCTPTRRTPEIIRLIAKEMKRGSYLIEITSQKAKTASALLKIPSKINPVCIHPMFGPGTKKIKGQNIISVPIKDAKKELSLVKSLFEGANFVTIDAAEHDKKIAIILGLTHLVNLAFANILAKDDKISLTERMSGTTFKVQKILAESIMTESTELIETIISNPEIRRAAEELWKDIGRLLTDIQEAKSEDITNYIRNIQEQLAKNSNLEESYKKLNTMVNAIEK
jgi:prephenate dehydrogenase